MRPAMLHCETKREGVLVGRGTLVTQHHAPLMFHLGHTGPIQEHPKTLPESHRPLPCPYQHEASEQSGTGDPWSALLASQLAKHRPDRSADATSAEQGDAPEPMER